MSGTEKENDRSAPNSNPWADASPRKRSAADDDESRGASFDASSGSPPKRTRGSSGNRAKDVETRGKDRVSNEEGALKGRRPLDEVTRRRGSDGSRGPRKDGGDQRSSRLRSFGASGPDPKRASRPTLAGTDGLSAALIREIEQRLRKHPSGRLVRARRETVPVSLEVPIASGKNRLATFSKDLDQALDAAILSLVSEREVAESGSAFCLRCGSASCEHGTPTSKQVFVGYATNGTPLLEDYGQALLDLGDPGMSHLFGGSGQVVTRLWSEEELTGQLLPAFSASDSGFRLLGQVTAGWYWVPSGFFDDEAERMQQGRNFALTFQIALIDVAGQPRRLTLNTIGQSPAGGSLEDLHDALGELPWEEARRWGRGALSDVERILKRSPAKKNAMKKGAKGEQLEAWHDRTLKILAGFERRLVRRERANRRKTRHAESRRKQKRPTGHALADLIAAVDGAVLMDTRNKTLVVLGDRGRTHIFNDTGRLVTSIVYGPEAIAKRRERGYWVAAEEEAIAKLRESAGPGIP